MAAANSEVLDPRIRRTRQLLQDALDKLLQIKNFDQISVQDIAEQATVNRATFYDHYPDKFALLESSIAARFHALLSERQVRFDGTCVMALGALVRAVCEFQAAVPGGGCERQKQLEQFMESSIIDLSRAVVLEGVKMHPPPSRIAPELIATTVAWAIYGVGRAWVHSSPRMPLDEMVHTVLRIIMPILSTGEIVA